MPEEKKVTFGLTEKAAYILIYLFGWLSGLIFYLSEKDDKNIRLHALQVLIFSAAFIVAMIILNLIFFFIWYIWAVISTILWILYWVVIVIAIIRACNGSILKLPVAYDIASKHA